MSEKPRGRPGTACRRHVWGAMIDELGGVDVGCTACGRHRLYVPADRVEHCWAAGA